MREVGAVLALILAALSLWVPVAGHALEFGLPGGAHMHRHIRAAIPHAKPARDTPDLEH